MAKPPGFDEWIKIANETGKTREERERLRADVYRRYGMKPPSDRGGIAGIWDRNKNIIKPIAQATAAYFGGPWAGAKVGAAMEGLDRPGKSGVGFDAGAAVRGGIQGYGVGQLAGAIPGSAASRAATPPPPKADIPPPQIETPLPKSVLDMGAEGLNVSSTPSPYSSARGMLAGGDDALVGQMVASGDALTPPTRPGMVQPTDFASRYGYPDRMTQPAKPPAIPAMTSGSITMPAIQSLPSSTEGMGMGEGNLLQRLLSGAGNAASNVAGGIGNYFANMKPEVLQGLLQGGGTALGGYLSRDAEQQRLEFLREQQRFEEERANRLARMLMPMAQAQGQMVGSQYSRPSGMQG